MLPSFKCQEKPFYLLQTEPLPGLYRNIFEILKPVGTECTIWSSALQFSEIFKSKGLRVGNGKYHFSVRQFI